MKERDELPVAARRWLERALPRGMQTPSQVVVSQKGSLESNERWLRFKAKGTYWTDPLAFDWRARLSIMLGMWAVASDGHDGDIGWGGAKLWGLMSLGARRGPEIQEMQLIRNLAELVWVPELALADPMLRWVDAGDEAFEIQADTPTRAVVVRFELDDAGDVVRASCPARPYDVPEGFEDAAWRYDLAAHREFDGVRLPASAVATYELPDGSWEYFRAEITRIERSRTRG